MDVRAAFQRVEEGEDRAKKKDGGEGVFEFGNPRDGGGIHGMDCKEQGSQPRARNAERHQNPPKQPCRERVQQDVDDVVAYGRLFPPEPPFEPETGEREGGVVARIFPLPDLREAMRVAHLRIGGEQGVVVPDISRADGGEISDYRAENEQGGEKAWVERLRVQGRFSFMAISSLGQYRPLPDCFDEMPFL